MINSDKFKLLYNISAILCGTLILCSVAIYNGYPLVFNSDTAMYIEAAVHSWVGADRPILYGLFMTCLSLNKTLWGPLIVQSFITSTVIFYYFRYFMVNNQNVPKMYFRIYFICFILLITMFMGGGFTASWLMPDIFTPVAILSIGLLLMCRLQKIHRAIISGIAIVSIAMHNSTPYISLILCMIILLFCIFKYTRLELYKVGVTVKKCMFVIALIIISQLLLATVHYQYGGGFKSSRGGAMFMMGSFVEMGIAKKYLDDNCGANQYAICQYKDSLPKNFLWDIKSPIYKNGGWKDNEKEYTKIVEDIIVTPKYLKLVLIGSWRATINQFFHYGTGEADFPSVRVREVLSANYGKEYYFFTQSKQYKGLLNFSILNNCQAVLFCLCILLYTILFFNKSVAIEFKLLIIFILLAIMINAWFCGTFSGVFHRYQSRVVWLLPLPLFLYALNFNSLKYKLGLIRIKIFK